MKHLQLIVIILSLFETNCFSQVAKTKNETISKSISGIWIVTDYNKLQKFQNTWEFISDGNFNELKSGIETYGKDTLIRDENGEWQINKDTLIIKVTNELIGTERKWFKEAQVLKFIIKNENDNLILVKVPDKNIKLDKRITLLLKRKK